MKQRQEDGFRTLFEAILARGGPKEGTKGWVNSVNLIMTWDEIPSLTLIRAVGDRVVGCEKRVATRGLNMRPVPEKERLLGSLGSRPPEESVSVQPTTS